MQNEAYQKLMDNLCDIVAEEQAKLGYMKEPIRLYYPLSSLNHFFGGDVSADEMQEKLSKFKSFAYDKFGEVEMVQNICTCPCCFLTSLCTYGLYSD